MKPQVRFLSILLVVMLIAVMQGCKKGDGGAGPGVGIYTGPTGSVTGVVRAANGTTPIQGAQVTVQANYSNMPTAPSDTNGNYTLAGVPVGSQTIAATKGLFRATVTVNVLENQTVTAPPVQLQSTGSLAYVVGSYDHIQDIVRDTLGYSMDEIQADSLGVASVLSRYRAIFLNCGMDLSFLFFDTAAATTLRNYVSSGGSLYISDLAQDVVRAMFPADVFNMGGGNPQTIYGRVVDFGLRAFVGRDSVQILYNLGGWQTLDSLSSRPQVLLRGDYTAFPVQGVDKPLAIIINHGSGRVVYTTFHNTANVTTDAVKVLTYFLFSL